MTDISNSTVPGTAAGGRPVCVPGMQRSRRQPAYVAQEIRLRLLHERGVPEMVLYRVFRLRGVLDVARLRDAVRRLVLRRDALRCHFELRGGRAWQVFRPAGEGPDLQEADFRGDEAGAIDWLRSDVAGEFPLFDSPSARFALARVGDEEHLFAFALTHMVGDGWTMDLIAGELGRLYGGEMPSAAPPFAAWARAAGVRLASVEAADREFWTGEFPEPPSGLVLPPPTADGPSGIEDVGATIDAGTVRHLRELAVAEGTSLYVVLLAAVHTVLSERRARAELTYTVNVANREDDDGPEVVGNLTHRVLLRLGRSGRQEGFGTNIGVARDVLLKVLEHASTPFRVVRGWLAERHGTETPESELVYVVLSGEWGGTLDVPGLDVSRVQWPRRDPGSAGLEFWFTERAGAVRLGVRYPPDRLTADEVRADCRAVVRLLTAGAG